MPTGSTATLQGGQGGGDRVCSCGVFSCLEGNSCIKKKIIQCDTLFLMKTESLQEFDACINLGRSTLPTQRTLVDSGPSANFMSTELYKKIIDTGGRYVLGKDG